MRILVGADVPPNPDSGAAGTVVATNAALRELGHQVDEIWADDLGHRIRHWNLHYLLELPREYRRAVAKRCARQEYDVIQLSQPYAWLAARDHHRRRRAGVIVNRSHGLESLANTALEEWRTRLGVPSNRFPRSLVSPFLQSAVYRNINDVARHSDGMIVPAEDIREHLIEAHGADPERVAVIYHGVPDVFIDTPRVALDEIRLKRILNVGQLSFIKGPQLMVKALLEAFSVDGDLSFTWVCSRAHHSEALALFPLEFRERVTLLDWVEQDSLLAMYDSHGIFVAHSVYEGAAKACTEAMARGLVLVSSAVGALKDHVNSGRNGYLVEVGESSRMAAHIVSASRQAELSRRIGDAAAEATKELTWRACATASEKFYRKLLSAESTR